MPSSAEHCPWQLFQPTTLRFCEDALCSWIRQPANTWSNLAYILVGLRLSIPRLRPLGVIAVLVGIFSGLYHASLIFTGEVLDLGAMFLLSSLLISWNLRRLGWLREVHQPVFYLSLVLFSIMGMILLQGKGIEIFTAQIGVLFITEGLLWQETRAAGISYRNYGIALGLFAVSYLCWILDYRRIVCEPDNHWLQGHALWHVFNSSVFVFLDRFYEEIRRSGKLLRASPSGV